MLAEERQTQIEHHLQRVEFASLEELAREVGASVSTVRRDVSQLAETGSIRRTHGGARLVHPKVEEYVFSSRVNEQSAEKTSIGKTCAELVAPNQTVILDAGSTVAAVARHLAATPLQIITNSLPVANVYASSSTSEVVVSGGVVYPRLGVLVGPQAVDMFKRAHADLAIMSASGITSNGIYNSHGLLIDIQTAMLAAADKVVFCMDSSKFGRRSIFQLCETGRISSLITDSGAPTETMQTIRDLGVDVLTAE